MCSPQGKRGERGWILESHKPGFRFQWFHLLICDLGQICFFTLKKTHCQPISLIRPERRKAGGRYDLVSDSDILGTIGREGNGTPPQYSCLENPMDGGAWWAAVHGISKSRTQLSDFPFTFHFHALDKEMATHSSVLAWRIPGTGEPGGLSCMVSHRVRRD